MTGSYADRRKPFSDSGQSCTSALGRKRSFNKLPLVKQKSANTLRYWSSSYEGGSESLAMHDAVGLKKKGACRMAGPLIMMQSVD